MPARFALFGTTGMYFPGMAAFIVRYFEADLRETTAGHVGIKRFYLFAWFLFPTLIAATIAVAILSGAARFDWSLQRLHTISRYSAWSVESLWRFEIIQLIYAISLGPVSHGLTTIGEELGWRDFLLPRLIRAGLGQWTALCVTGIIWGMWHIPLILLGLEYVAHPYLGIPMFIVFAVLVGTILGWLQLASGSVWVPTFAHASLNIVQQTAFVFIVPENPLVGGSLGSIIGWLILVAFIAWLAITRRLPHLERNT